MLWQEGTNMEDDNSSSSSVAVGHEKTEKARNSLVAIVLLLLSCSLAVIIWPFQFSSPPIVAYVTASSSIVHSLRHLEESQSRFHNNKQHAHRHSQHHLKHVLNTSSVSLSCEIPRYLSNESLPGELSEAELILRTAFDHVFQRNPTMRERQLFYNELKTKEISMHELVTYLHYIQELFNTKQIKASERHDFIEQRRDWELLFPWKDRMKNQIYLWTTDFHPSPSGCNLNLYASINVVVHPEVDHHPFCEYYGVCRKRLHPMFGLGSFMAGFSLDPDHNNLKKHFYTALVNDSEFQRIDGFICSHPASNCELFERFQKPIILYFTTRLEFGRNDMKIDWRVRAVSRWRSGKEVEPRQLEWVTFILRHHIAKDLFIAANSMFDVNYVEYFTGIRPVYIPSWCGDADHSYGQRKEWSGCGFTGNTSYLDVVAPSKQHTFIIAPYKQPLWAYSPAGINKDNKLYHELLNATKAFKLKYYVNETGVPSNVSNNGRKYILPNIKHSLHEIHNSHNPEKYLVYPGVIFISYQTSVMTLFELYRLNIPIFAPSLNLLVRWNVAHNLVGGRVYGTPRRYENLIRNTLNVTVNTSIPNPNTDNKNISANRYWLAFSDIYVMKHIILFDNWTHLMELTNTVNLTAVRLAMREANIADRIYIQKAWDKLFQQAFPKIHRGEFIGDVFQPNVVKIEMQGDDSKNTTMAMAEQE